MRADCGIGRLAPGTQVWAARRPIYIDQTVMACCNAAYDAAAFHGAREVRLEHLLYALTRVDAAREILEQHGLRTSPAAARRGRGRSSKRCQALEERRAAPWNSRTVLRRAAGRAGQDGVPASVQDLLRVLLGYGRTRRQRRCCCGRQTIRQQLERWGGEPRAGAAEWLAAAATPWPRCSLRPCRSWSVGSIPWKLPCAPWLRTSRLTARRCWS